MVSNSMITNQEKAPSQGQGRLIRVHLPLIYPIAKVNNQDDLLVNKKLSAEAKSV
jgi:hypothetical protein